MKWNRFFESLAAGILSLRGRLLLLLLATITVTLVLVGTALVFLISDFHENAASRRFDETFKVIGARLGERKENLMQAARAFAEREDVISSLNMFHHYAKPGNYNPLIFDPEKRNLVRELAEAAKATGLHQLTLHGADGDPVAYFLNGSPQHRGYLSYGKDGRPVVLAAEGVGEFEPDMLPKSVAVPVEARGLAFGSSWSVAGLTVAFTQPVKRVYPDGSSETVGLVTASEFLGGDFVSDIESRTGVRFALFFEGSRFGDLDGVTLAELLRARSGEAGRFPAFSRIQHSDYFLAAAGYPLSSGGTAYLVSAQPKAAVVAAIRETRTVVIGVLFVSAFLMIPVGVAFLRRAVLEPVAHLVKVVEAIRRGEYETEAKLQRKDELGALARAFDEMSSTIRLREEALAEREAQYRTLVENLPQRIYSKDRSLVYVSSNQRFAADLGLSPDQVIGKSDYDLFPADVAEQHRASDLRIMETGHIEEFEERSVAGSPGMLVQIVKAPLLDAEGRCQGVLGIFWDITARKEAEQKLRQSAAVFENTAEGVMITEVDGTIIAVNRAFTEITGYEEKEILGKTPAVRHPEGQDDGIYERMWEALKVQGRWQGEIWSRRKDGEIYPEWMTISAIYETGGSVSHYVAVFSDITVMKQSEKELNRLAYHDPLTGLPNRALMGDRLEHAIERARRGSTRIAVLFLDLDRFKDVNDTLGHPVGDLLLKDTGRRLTECLRSGDTVARLGGDEFVVVLEEISDTRQVENVAAKLLDSFVEPYCIQENELFVRCSIGISLFPDDGEDVSTLIKNADAAMYRAKEQGRHNYKFYTHELTSSVAERMGLEAALRRASKRGEFELFYQPQVLLPSGRIGGAEALLRWHHPERGMVPPEKFVPLAEESGLIVHIGNWVLETACAQVRRWLDAGIALERISVNLSGVQIQQGDIVGTVRRILEESGLKPEHLELELTESTIMRRSKQAVDTLDRLRKLGVHIAVDDFGTGYSSLNYLKRFPITNLKIDKSFVRDTPGDINGELITNAVIALAKSLELEVTAEGVETAIQEKFLIEHGCQRAQGYFYSPPLNARAFERYMRRKTQPLETGATSPISRKGV